jgi:HSP20 family protein
MWYNYNSKIFNDVLNGTFAYLEQDTSTYHLIDRGEQYLATIPIPGAKKEDIKISIKESGVLILSYQPEKKNPYVGSFDRAWKVLNVDFDNIKADYVDGILTVSVPKVKPPVLKVKTILVN